MSLDSDALIESIFQRLDFAELAQVIPARSDLYYNPILLMSFFGEHELALELSDDFLEATIGKADRERALAHHAKARALRDAGQPKAALPHFSAAIELADSDAMKSMFSLQLAAAEAKTGQIGSALARADITDADRQNPSGLHRLEQEILIEEAVAQGDYETAYSILGTMSTAEATRLKARISAAARAAKIAVSQDAAVIDARVAEETAKLEAERVERALAEARAARARLLSFAMAMLAVFSIISAFYVLTQLRRERAWRIREQSMKAEIEVLAVRAQGAARAKQQFISMMSHEIRTPLNHIMPTVQSYIERESGDPRSRIMCRIIDRAANRLLRISDEISMLAGGTDTLVFMPEEFALDDLLDSIASEKSKGYVLNESLELVVEAGATLPSHIAADRTKIDRVLVALLENALKFGGHAAVDLAMRFEDAPEQDDGAPGVAGHMVFSVTDRGGGIPDEDMQRVMLPFTQKDMSTTRPVDGMGVGLTLVALLCRVMEAEFTLDGQFETRGETGTKIGTRATVRVPAFRTDGRGTWKPAEESELRKAARAQLLAAAA